MRIGHGYDVHAFTAGDHVNVGGLRIACDVGVRAHSDGDVAIHALCDALLGAAALGDIGRLFPDTDPAWAGADSRDLLAEVIAHVGEAGWAPINLDITVIAEKPRIGAHVEKIRPIIARLAGVAPDAVSVKATTHEGIGGLGRGEGIAAHAVVLLGHRS